LPIYFIYYLSIYLLFLDIEGHTALDNRRYLLQFILFIIYLFIYLLIYLFLDIEGHIALDNRKYLLDFARVFPPVCHKFNRKCSYLFQHLRPVIK